MSEFYSKKVVKPMSELHAAPMPFCDEYPRGDTLEYYELGASFDGSPPLSVKIFPNIGAKSTGLCFDHQPYELSGEIWDPYLYLSAPWGSYIPYPTPNRVRDSAFIFHGERVLMKKFGHLRDSHGLAYDSRWQYDEPVLFEGGVAMRLWLEMQPGDENFPAFPYRNRLTVEYRITERCLSFSYRVDNLDERPMPYGLCKHPFFMRADPKEPILIKVEADSVYETTPELLPTGRFLPVADHPEFDLRSFRSLDDICLDNEYTHLHGDSVYIRYPMRGRQLRIRMSEDFQNVVVFTMKAYKDLFPPNDLPEVFCIESQTCCTDAINMHERGFAESGLIILEAGESHSGWIRYQFEDIKGEETHAI